MDDSNSLNQIIQKGDILSLANSIYSLLNINKEIESEDELFSDEVYIEIISIFIPDLQDEISPGNTPEEKVETINMLLSLLSKLIETNISEIDAEKIVLEHDKENVKNFLELLLGLINSLVNCEEEIEDEQDFMNKHNISDGNLNKKKIKFKFI